jgi:ATP-dependent RNA helicase DDX47/RRP3
VNCSVPVDVASYVHRVGRTARAGRAGRSITVVSQFEVKESEMRTFDGFYLTEMKCCDLNEVLVVLFDEMKTEMKCD